MTEQCIQSLLDALGGQAGALGQISEVHKHYLAVPPNTILAKQNQLRALCVLIEAQIPDSSCQRFNANLRRELSAAEVAERDHRLELVEDALDLCRRVSPDGARDSSHDPYYLRFRSRLQMAKARLQWQGAAGHEPFRDSDWYLEAARAGVSSDDHAGLARLEMTWAEGLLLQANISLSDPCGRDLDARNQALASARVDYLRAGDALQRAREHLTRGSRGVERWACYQRLWTQYQAEWCLFHLAHLEGTLRGLGNDIHKNRRELADLAPRGIATLLKRLKRGLNGLQAGLVIQPDGNKDEWLRRLWLELLCAGMVYGVATVAGTSCYEDAAAESPWWPLGIDRFWDHWHLMNERAGIPATIELEGVYRDYLTQTIADPRDLSPRWRHDLVSRVRDANTSVSMLRDCALAIAGSLYHEDPHDCALALVHGITALVRPADKPAEPAQHREPPRQLLPGAPAWNGWRG